MTQELLPYYERELLFIRQMAADFGERYPDLAASLQLNAGASQDPHVERLVEAFALIAARIQRKIEDEFPEITEALLDTLYPHYLRPIPSAAIAQFEADPEQGNLSSGYVIPRGSTLYSAPVGGATCRFRTCYPVHLWPLELFSAAFVQSSQLAAGLLAADAPFGLRLQFRCTGGADLAKLPLRSLRFHLGGDPRTAHTLYELLINNVARIAVRKLDAKRVTPVLALPSVSVGQIGFTREEEMLPYSDRSFQGYRLLQEYFAFPEKFLFFDIAGLDRIPKGDLGQQFELLILFAAFERQERARLLEQAVDRSTFQLGCTPIINLFERYAEPIRLSHTETEYRVIPDIHTQHAAEVYSVNRVTSSNPDADLSREYRPFYSFRHADPDDRDAAFWHATRRRSQRNGDNGTEVYLSLLDLNFKPHLPPVDSLTVQVTCTNRDLPERLPVRYSFGELDMESGTVLRIRFLRAPTPCVRPPLRRGLQWRLISHLSLNHLSIVEAIDPLREVLKLYDFGGDPSVAHQISGLIGITSRSKVARVSSPHGVAFCPGVHVDLLVDEEHFAGSGVFLLGSVLERFFGLYSSINSFSQLKLRTVQRKGVLREWAPRTGEQIVL
jgi:type VI secretion system protein ImpG